MNDFQNANTLAHAVSEAARGQYSPRPYNRYSPDETTWWLVPSTDWPAFKYAKLFFHAKPGDIPEGLKGIHCGLSVEKGLDVKVKDFYPRELIKTALWDWDSVVASLVTSWPKLSTPQFISLSLSYIPPDGSVTSVDSFLDLKKTFRASHSFFKVGSDLRLDVHGTPYLNSGCIEIAEHFQTQILPSTDVPTLLHRLESFPQSDWCWIDLYIGTVVDGGDVGSLWNESLSGWCGLFPSCERFGAIR
jgi:hypothetical protein